MTEIGKELDSIEACAYLMIQKTGIAAIDEVLHQMDKAIGRDEFKDASGLLPPVTRNYIDKIIAHYDSRGYRPTPG